MLERESSGNLVLIGYPKGFGLENLFRLKISQILRNLDDYSVIAVDDYRGYIQNVFGNRIIESVRSESLHLRDVKKIVGRVTYAVIFWDGCELTDFVYHAMQMHKKFRVITVTTTRVANKDNGEEFDVYIGRGTPWGNPFAIGVGGDNRDTVIKRYKEYFENTILADKQRMRELISLKGKRLGCHCKPLPCHGDIIAEHLNTYDGSNFDNEEENNMHSESFDAIQPQQYSR